MINVEIVTITIIVIIVPMIVTIKTTRARTTGIMKSNRQ